MLTQMVEVVVMTWDQLLPYACHQYSVHLFRKRKWRTLVANGEEKYRLGGEWKKNSK